ncbi:MAG: formylglycine-generating enzyme family protein [Pirellulaceae bacterium]
MPTLIRVVACFLVVFGLAASQETQGEEVLGISKTKPAEGRFVEIEGGYMVPYVLDIPGTDVQVKMVPIPGGKFKMGSPESEVGRDAAEGPQVEIEIEPFWMAEHETTWAQYKPYMALYDIFKRFSSDGIRAVTDDNLVDAVTAPTPLYEPSFTYEHGEDPKLPAVTMTQYTAQQYTRWLSGITDRQYRLPSEAEWEYAAKAGATTAYHFGDAPEKLDDYAWYEGNSDEGPHLVAKKKPNPWGLYDMHGNVWEWVLDAYSEEGHKRLEGKTHKALDSINWPSKPFPLMVKGGGWGDPAEKVRAAAKMGSDDDEWKSEDPNIPLSPWWFTSYPSTMVGFRVIRPLKELPMEEAKRFYEPEIEYLQLDVNDRMLEGRGAKGLVDPQLPGEIKKIDTR